MKATFRTCAMLLCLTISIFTVASPAEAQQTWQRIVFLILMENNNWSSIKGNPSAPYINQLLKMGAHAQQYFTPLHPSEPNYIWFEAGTNFGILNDADPNTNHIA